MSFVLWTYGHNFITFEAQLLQKPLELDILGPWSGPLQTLSLDDGLEERRFWEKLLFLILCLSFPVSVLNTRLRCAR